MTQLNPKAHYSFECAGEPLAERLVFLTGVNRSGTTLLGNLIGSLKNVEYDFEPWVFHTIPMMVASGQIQPQAASEIFRGYFNETLTASILGRSFNFRPSDDTCIRRRLSMAEISVRWEKIKDRQGVKKYVLENGSTLCLKAINFAPFLGLLWNSFSNLKVIHILRHPFHVAASIQKKGWMNTKQLQEIEGIPVKKKVTPSEGQPLFLPWWVDDSEVDYFLGMTEFGRALYGCRILAEMTLREFQRLGLPESGGGRFLEVKYEDLLANPKAMMESVSHFLETDLTQETQALIQTVKTERLQDKIQFPLDQVPERERIKLAELMQKGPYSDEASQNVSVNWKTST